MKGFIFDFDGVIVDSERYWPEETFATLQSIVPTLTRKQSYTTMGKSAYDIHEWLQTEFKVTLTLDEFLEAAGTIATRVYGKTALMPGVQTFVEAVRSYTPHIAIGTSGKREWVLPTMQHLGIGELFETIVTSSDVPVGESKPRPTIFLEAAKQMGIEPSQCIVLEDSKNGVAAGKAAGMYTIGLTHLDHGQDVSAADAIVRTYQEIPLKQLFN